MSKLPRISGKECIQALQRAGFYFKRQERSHIILRRDNPPTQVAVHNHLKPDWGTLRAIIRQAGLSIEEFIRLL
jgi:predicted RNA binding protein YcfA (HicA-like mRNA interferase family)